MVIEFTWEHGQHFFIKKDIVKQIAWCIEGIEKYFPARPRLAFRIFILNVSLIRRLRKERLRLPYCFFRDAVTLLRGGYITNYSVKKYVNNYIEMKK